MFYKYIWHSNTALTNQIQKQFPESMEVLVENLPSLHPLNHVLYCLYHFWLSVYEFNYLFVHLIMFSLLLDSQVVGSSPLPCMVKRCFTLALADVLSNFSISSGRRAASLMSKVYFNSTKCHILWRVDNHLVCSLEQTTQKLRLLSTSSSSHPQVRPWLNYSTQGSISFSSAF